jgi:hypothetical protein
MNHNARQSHADRWRNSRTVGGGGLIEKERLFEADGISGSPTGILPSVTVIIPQNTFDLASMDADILQDMIVERLQPVDRQPFAALAAHPGPEPGNWSRKPGAPTETRGLHPC